MQYAARWGMKLKSGEQGVLGKWAVGCPEHLRIACPLGCNRKDKDQGDTSGFKVIADDLVGTIENGSKGMI